LIDSKLWIDVMQRATNGWRNRHRVGGRADNQIAGKAGLRNGKIDFIAHGTRQSVLLGVADDSVPEAVKEEIPFLVGQAVAITEGPFTDFNGTVEEVLPDKGKVRVSVSLFGRPTSVELDYLQLKGY